MAVMTYSNIKVEDLDQRLIDSIRALFIDRTVEISIVVKAEDKKFLVNLDEILRKNRESPFVVRFETDFDFNELAEQLEKDEDFDVKSVFEERKIPNPYVIAP